MPSALGIVASAHAEAGLVYDSLITHWHNSAVPPLTSDIWTGSVIEWPEGTAHQNNGRSGVNARWLYEANPTHTDERKVYGYAGSWLDGAVIRLMSGTALKIIEWKRGTDTWRQTLLYSPGATHTINLADTTSGDLVGPTPAPTPWDNVFLERDDTAEGVFSCRVTLAHPISVIPPATATATAGDAEIDFSWTGHYPHYEVRIGGGTWIDKGTANTHTFTGLTNGTSYLCEVRIVAPYGNSDPIGSSATPLAGLGLVPLLAYNFAETGTTVTDRSGNGRDAVMRRAGTLTDLHVSGEFAPTASTDQVVYATDAAARPANASVTAKIRTLGTVGEGNVWARFRASNSSSFNLYLDGNQLRAVVRGTSAASVITTAGPTLATNTTYQVALTYDGTTTRLYRNGVEYTTATTATGAIDWSGSDLNWYSYYSSLDTSLIRVAFVIDDIRFFNVALSAAEVATLAGIPVT